GEYIWDDDEWLTQNQAVLHWNTFLDLWTPGKTPHFFPLVTSSYWIEHKLWGLNPVGYHITNLLLHIASSLILFRIIERVKLPGGRLAAWLVAALFAVHPVNVETVAWVAERKNTLCGLFLFASAFYAFRLYGLFEADAPRKRDIA